MSKADNLQALSRPEYNLHLNEKMYKWMCIVSLIYVCWYLFLKVLVIFDLLKLNKLKHLIYFQPSANYILVFRGHGGCQPYSC
jgi:hypothetical protein